MDFNNPAAPINSGAGDIQSILINQNVVPQQVDPVIPQPVPTNVEMDLTPILQAQQEMQAQLLQQQQEALQAQLLQQQQEALQAQLLLQQQQQAQAAALQAQAIQSSFDPNLLGLNAITPINVGATMPQQAVNQDINAFIAQTLNTIPTPGIGNPIFIPANIPQTGIIKNYTNYNYFYGKWSKGSAQRNLSEVWNAAGRTSDRGIATLNNRYLVAVSPTFGKVGDNIDVCLDNGVIIPCTIADAKGADAKSKWGHTFGKAVDVIEWESMGNQSVINTDGWQGHRVDRIVNYTA